MSVFVTDDHHNGNFIHPPAMVRVLGEFQKDGNRERGHLGKKKSVSQLEDSRSFLSDRSTVGKLKTREL